MSVFQSQQPIIIPDPSDPTFGPSGFNVPICSTTVGNPVSVTIANNSSTKAYTIAANLFPQGTGGTKAYRVTVNAFLDLTTPIAGAPTGNVGIIVGRRLVSTAFQTLGESSIRLTSGLATGVNSYFPTVSAIFIPAPGDTLEVLVENYTGASITVTLSTQQGSGIELVSNQSTSQLIFS